MTSPIAGEREALRILIAAIEYRSACLVAGNEEKLRFADEQLWKAIDAGKAALLEPVGEGMRVVAYANPVILLPADEGDPECEWTARVQGNQDDVFSLPLYAASPKTNGGMGS